MYHTSHSRGTADSTRTVRAHPPRTHPNHSTRTSATSSHCAPQRSGRRQYVGTGASITHAGPICLLTLSTPADAMPTSIIVRLPVHYLGPGSSRGSECSDSGISKCRSPRRSTRTSPTRYRLWRPGVRMAGNHPLSAHRVTVLRETRKIALTSPGYSRSSSDKFSRFMRPPVCVASSCTAHNTLRCPCGPLPPSDRSNTSTGVPPGVCEPVAQAFPLPQCGARGDGCLTYLVPSSCEGSAMSR